MPHLAAKFGNAPQELCDPVGFQGDGLGGGGGGPGSGDMRVIMMISDHHDHDEC